MEISPLWLGKDDLSIFHSQAQMLLLLNGGQSDFFGNGRRGFFTENYLVFNLNERMPQITEIYFDKEDDVLDYNKRVIFGKRRAWEEPEAEQTTSNAIEEDSMAFDDSQPLKTASGYILLVDHNYPVKSNKPSKELTP
jgi:hypothetical protein